MMKHLVLILAACLAASGRLSAFDDQKPEWADETVTGINKEKACTTGLPFDTEQQATTLQPEDSPYYRTLNGTWRFHWVADPAERPATFYEPEYDVSEWDSIRVPVPWQIEAARRQKAWDKPLYCNTIYPFAPVGRVQWPNVIQPRPDNYTFATMPNPVGSYRRTFTVPDEWKGRDVYLRFNGVEAGFYVWVNGHEVGYSEDSYLPAEFKLTPYLKEGTNTLAVEVYRFTDGSYLECQDFWRFSGIFRDVFLWSAPKTQIRDFFFRTDLDSQYRDADVTLDVDVEGRKLSRAKLAVKLSDEDGTVLYHQQFDATVGPNRLTFGVPNPQKWTAETPHLYNLTLTLLHKGRTIDLRSCKVGFREIELAADGRFLVNGKPIRFKGVNRHDHSQLNGRTVSKEEMEKDVQLMKQLNLNAVRTSHYPNNPYFYDLCDRYGLYVLAEANVECHGLMSLSEQPTWQKAFVERNENMVLRYRNHPAIVIWSLGNESGRGLNHQAAERAIKALDTTRPSHYEGNSDYCDLTSTMYSSVQWTENVGKERLQQSRRGEAVRPHVLCEYAHAMGNAMGNFREYWETFERYPALIGGFVWDWVDQSILMPTPDGKGFYKAVGGDFGDIPNDNNFCTNGIIFADRTYSAKALEVKKILQPVGVTQEEGLRFRIGNKRFHTGIDDLYGEYTVSEDGRVVRAGRLADLHLAPQESIVVSLPDSLLDFPHTDGAEYFIQFSFRQKYDTFWAKAGYEVAAEQIRLSATPKPFFRTGEGRLTVEETPDAYVVKGADFTATFGKEQGTLTQYVLDGGVQLIDKGPQLNVFRAPTDNDKPVAADWQRLGLRDLALQAGQWSVAQTDSTVTLQVENRYDGLNGCSFRNTVAYTVGPDGSILVNSIILPSASGEILPRVGYKMYLPEGFERMRWLGCGPYESYPDRKDATPVGLYDQTVSEQWVDYVRPQIMGNHEDVRWIAITDANGRGFAYVAADRLSAAALHADERDMVHPDDLRRLKHAYEVPRLKETVLCLDARHRPLGNASCGPGPLEKYELRSQPLSFGFLMMPLKRSYSTEELSRKARVQLPVCAPVLIDRDSKGYLTLSTATPDADIYYRIGNGQTDYQRYSGPVECRKGGKVTAYATADHRTKSFETTLQLPVYVNREAWKVVSASSEERGEEARNVIDGDPNTIWHSRWSGENVPRHPHEIVVDMASTLTVSQFLYQPRNSENGRIKDYELYFSQDGKHWGEKISGRFADSGSVQTVDLPAPVAARYFKLVALSEQRGREWASAAELSVNVIE